MGEEQPGLAMLEALRKQIILYISIKVTAEDWHAVADAAMDLREIDAKLEVYRSLKA